MALERGALIAWRGDARRPVALLPMSRRANVMVEPGSPGRRSIDESSASELAAEAAMLYPKLPSTALSPSHLLSFCTRHVAANAGQIDIGALAMATLSLAVPLITQVLINSVIPRTEFDQLGYLTAALVIVTIGMTSLQAMQGIAMLRLEGLLDWKLQAAILDRLLRLPVSFFRQYTVGDLADRTLGVDAVRRVATGRTLRGLLAGLFGLFSLLLMFYYDIRLALIATVLAALRGLVILAVSTVRLYHERRHVELRGKVEGLVLQLLTAVGKLRVAGATIRALAVWGNQFAAQKRHFIASQRAANALRMIEAAFPTVATLIVFAASQDPSAGSLALDLGAFLAFFAAFGQSMAAVGEWGTAIGDLLIAVPYLSRMRPLMTNPVEISEERKSPGELSGAIDLSKVTFRDAWRAADPRRRHNSGGPGRVCRYCRPLRQRKIDHLPTVAGVRKPEIGRRIFFRRKGGGYAGHQRRAPPDRRRFAGSQADDRQHLREHLQRHPIPDGAGMGGRTACRSRPGHRRNADGNAHRHLGGSEHHFRRPAAAAHDCPCLDPPPPHSPVRRGDELARQPDQSVVSASLAKLNVTRIVIAHRLSTVQHVDRIIVLVAGRVVQSGTFEELSAATGMFAEFARRQLL